MFIYALRQQQFKKVVFLMVFDQTTKYMHDKQTIPPINIRYDTLDGHRPEPI